MLGLEQDCTTILMLNKDHIKAILVVCNLSLYIYISSATDYLLSNLVYQTFEIFCVSSNLHDSHQIFIINSNFSSSENLKPFWILDFQIQFFLVKYIHPAYVQNQQLIFACFSYVSTNKYTHRFNGMIIRKKSKNIIFIRLSLFVLGQTRYCKLLFNLP